jgi:hypothetical protein
MQVVVCDQPGEELFFTCTYCNTLPSSDSQHRVASAAVLLRNEDIVDVQVTQMQVPTTAFTVSALHLHPPLTMIPDDSNRYCHVEPKHLLSLLVGIGRQPLAFNHPQ